jgi:hypothetical protein
VLPLRNAKDPWTVGGPSLPLEFCRVSRSRGGALTLVIDEVYGVDCETSYAISLRRDAEDVISDLRCREGTTLRNIGHLSTAGAQPTGDPIRDRILEWAKITQVSSVTWTALKSNFEAKVETPFTPEAAAAYLETMDSEGAEAAVQYISRAPAGVRTPARALITSSAWWTKQVETQDKPITLIQGPSDLLKKLQRSQHRAWHARHPVHLADALYDFCVTALALRDHVFVLQDLDDGQRTAFHEEWAQDPEWAACRDIANAFKHLRLRRASGLHELRATTTSVVDVYTDGERLERRDTEKPELEIVWPDGSTIDTWDLTSAVLAKWAAYFANNGIPHIPQDEAEFFG